jgi:membrane protease YdiL (CAAX protease family)
MQGKGPALWGFTINRPAIVCLGLIIILSSVLYFRLPEMSNKFQTEHIWMIYGAALEELVFRVYLINLLIEYFGITERRIFLAILASCAIFTIPHLPTYSLSRMPFLFLSAGIVAYIYYFSRSIVLPMFIHILSNTGMEIGLIGAWAGVIIYVIIALIGKYWEHRDFRVGSKAQTG